MQSTPNTLSWIGAQWWTLVRAGGLQCDRHIDGLPWAYRAALRRLAAIIDEGNADLKLIEGFR
jgi:hypothetical protein